MGGTISGVSIDAEGMITSGVSIDEEGFGMVVSGVSTAGKEVEGVEGITSGTDGVGITSSLEIGGISAGRVAGNSG